MMLASDALAFEDFVIGQMFRSGPIRMEPDRMIAFAEEFDPQPQHLGTDSASTTMFGELVASGWHTAATSMRLYVEALPPIAGGGQGVALEDLTWPHPVRPGDDLHIELDVIAVRESRSRPDKGLVKIRAITRNQGGQIVQTATHTVMVPRRGHDTDKQG
jgi:acyl dehydratase